MNKTIIGLCLMASLSLSFCSCSSDDDDNNSNVDVKVKPSGNWYADSCNCELQFMTGNIGGKDTSLCVITVEDTKNDTVYTMKGGVTAFKAPVTTVMFPSSVNGPTSATLTYKGSQLAVQMNGGKTKIADFIASSTSSHLYSVGGKWTSTDCTAYFKRGTKQTAAQIVVTVDKKQSIYNGTYTYDKNTGKGTFSSNDKKISMTFTTIVNSKTNVSSLTLVNGKTSYTLVR